MHCRPPPLDFIPVQDCQWAELADGQPEFIRRHAYRGRRRQGVKYEAVGQVWLKDQFGANYTASPWIRFRADGEKKIRWCQPDGLLVDAEHRTVIIVEFKYQHTEAAWWQLFRLYLPVVSRLLAGRARQMSCIEICKWFDPIVQAPMPPKLCQHVLAVQPGEFGVHIWKP